MLCFAVFQSQYRFVCEAILKVYEEELVKPLTPPSPGTPPEIPAV